MGRIAIEGIKLYAYHGVIDEEGMIGGEYIVDVYLDTNFEKAADTDDLNETIDYSVVYKIVKEQMAIRSKLIEHAGKRILDAIYARFAQLNYAEVKVSKLNPPLHGELEKVSITVSR